MKSTIDLVIIALYLLGTVAFGCSFFFRKGKEDGAKEFMTGGGKLPTWAIALSVFATHVSSISFLALPEGAYASHWWGWVNSVTVPVATLVAARWFVPFYRKATSVSAYSFLEQRFGTWARIYASACFLVMQSARSGIILLLLAILVNQLLGFSYESIILVTGVATLVYSMMGGFKAVVWADAIQSIILIGGTLVCVGCLLWFTPDLAGNAQAAWQAGKISLGSLDLSDWGSNTFWVLFLYGICINLQNFGVDQCYTQRYVAAKDEKAAARSIWGSACLYVPVTLLFTVIGTLLWMYNHATGGVPEGLKAAEVFPWFIMNKLPVGVRGLLVAAIVAAAMSTVAATLNSGSTVLLEDYWKRFCPARATERGNLVFLRAMTVLLAAVSIVIALAVVWIWGKDNGTVLGMWYVLQGVLSGGMLGLFLIGAFAKRTRAVHAAVATGCGFLALAWVTFGQQVLPLPWALHKNLSIVFATLAIVVVGFLLGRLAGKAKPARGPLLALVAACALALPAEPEAAASLTPRTKISVFAHYVHNVAKERKVSLAEAADLLYAEGVRGFDDSYASAGLPALAATRLRPINLYGWVKFLAPDGGAAEAEKFLETAKRYGVPRVMVIPDRFTPGGDEEAEFQGMVKGLRSMVARAKAMGVTVTVEDFGGDPLSPCNRMVYLKRFLDEIPGLRLALDSGNLYYARRGEDILELMRHAGDRVAHVHLKDQLASDRRTYAELGLGGVPNREIVHDVTRRGYDGWFTLENTVVGADTLLEAVRQVATLQAWRRGL